MDQTRRIYGSLSRHRRAVRLQRGGAEARSGRAGPGWGRSIPVRLEAEGEPGAPLEHEAALHPVALAPHDDEGSGEANHLEVLLELLGVPHVAVLRLQVLPGAGAGVDLAEHLASDRF